MDSSSYRHKLVSAAEAVKAVRSGDGVYLHSNAGVPRTLVDAMTARAPELSDVRIYQLITLGPAPYADAKVAGSFYVHAMFIGPNVRRAVSEARADYTPVFFSELPRLFYERRLPVDVVMVQVAPPDENGNMSFGLALDCTPAAMKNARVVIAEINKQTPRTKGSHSLHVDDAHYIVEADYELPEWGPEEPNEVELAIGRNVAALVEDGATIQMGIGAIPDAVLRALTDKKDLGVHSEMVSDGIVELVKKGVVNNSKKTVLPGRMAVSFMFGSQRLYKFMDNNPVVEFHPTEFINDPYIISQNHKMTAINSALQVDLTGQVCADSLGSDMYSGCGGQVDFVRGARHCPGGKAIIALPSTAKEDTISRIRTTLMNGSGVVTTRADVQFVVTEYGIADLYGRNLKDRVYSLINIAHPAFRAELEEQAHSQFKWLGSRALITQ